MSNTYRCERCGKEYKKEWTDEEANKETEQYFGIKNASNKLGLNPCEMAIICDDCWKIIMCQ